MVRLLSSDKHSSVYSARCLKTALKIQNQTKEQNSDYNSNNKIYF